jgi:hypothetical protein
MQGQLDSMRRDRNRVVVEHAALDLAAKLARPGCNSLLMPHILGRLEAREEGGALVISAKGASGLDDLAEQLRTDPAFAPIIQGASPAEKAGHARRVAETTGQQPPPPTLTRRQFEALSPARRAEHARAGGTILDS